MISGQNPVTPKSSIFLGGSCIAFIASVGSIFELSSGEPDLGFGATAVILSLAFPLGIGLFIAAARDARANQ